MAAGWSPLGSYFVLSLNDISRLKSKTLTSYRTKTEQKRLRAFFAVNTHKRLVDGSARRSAKKSIVHKWYPNYPYWSSYPQTIFYLEGPEAF
jgi:hypothetical protein